MQEYFAVTNFTVVLGTLTAPPPSSCFYQAYRPFMGTGDSGLSMTLRGMLECDLAKVFFHRFFWVKVSGGKPRCLASVGGSQR